MINFIKSIFSRQKLINVLILNVFGLQIVRMLLSRVIYFFRKFNSDPEVYKYIEILKKDGILKIENFLNDDEYREVRNDSEKIFSKLHDYENKRVVKGPNLLESIYIKSNDLKDCNNIAKIFSEKMLFNLYNALNKSVVVNRENFHFKLQRITQNFKKDSNDIDEDTYFHEDTYFDTYKIFYFIDEVKLKDGPFKYVLGSHKITFWKLMFSYLYSIRVFPWKDTFEWRKITKTEVSFRKLKTVEFVVPKNTLLVANVNGYHGRLQGDGEGSRKALGMNIRLNPFGRNYLRV